MCNLFRAYVRCTKKFLFFPFPRRPARPDPIVTEESYNIVSHSVKGQRCAEFDEPRTLGAWASCRLHWLETLFSFNLVGIVHHANINEFPGQPLFANTDMAENWHQLGFIVQRPSYGLEPIFVETQRGDIPRKSETIHPKPQSPEEKYLAYRDRGVEVLSSFRFQILLNTILIMCIVCASICRLPWRSNWRLFHCICSDVQY